MTVVACKLLSLWHHFLRSTDPATAPAILKHATQSSDNTYITLITNKTFT